LLPTADLSSVILGRTLSHLATIPSSNTYAFKQTGRYP
jgi:hypothetical protein